MKAYDGRGDVKNRPKPTKWVGGAGHWGKRCQGRKTRAKK